MKDGPLRRTPQFRNYSDAQLVRRSLVIIYSYGNTSSSRNSKVLRTTACNDSAVVVKPRFPCPVPNIASEVTRIAIMTDMIDKENIGTGAEVSLASLAANGKSKIPRGPVDVSSPRSATSGVLSSSSSINIVVYDRDHAVEALGLLLERDTISPTEAGRLVRQVIKYIDYADGQRQSMVEKEAVMSTTLMQTKQELAAVKKGYEESKREGRELKRATERFMGEKEEMAAEMKDLRIALEFARKKEGLAVEACQRAGSEVEEVKRRAAMKIDDAHKRLQELEVQMHLAGGDQQGRGCGPASGQGQDSDRETIEEAEEIFRLGRRPATNDPSDIQDLDGSAVKNASQHVYAGKSRSQHDENRLVRSEMALMQRKVDKSNALLNKTTRAAQKIQEKLIEERKKVAALQEERSQLQEQIVKLHQKPQGLDPSQVGKLIHDLATARSKVEHLDLERSNMAEKLSTLQSEMTSVTEGQKQALMEADAAATRALDDEKARCEKLQGDVEALVKHLHEANASLEDFHATQASLEESQKRCAELAGMLDQEQRASYDRAMEVERLAKAAQACATELVSMREELHGERSKVQRLENENAGLVGRVEALSEAVSSQKKSSEVIEKLAEGRAIVQGRLQSTESEREQLKAKTSELEGRLLEARTYIEELESVLESLQDDLSKSQAENQTLNLSLTATSSDLEHTTQRSEELQSALDETRKSLEQSRRTVVSLQRELEENSSDLSKARGDFEDMCDCLKASEDNNAALLEEKNALAQQNGRLEVEVEHLKITINRLDQQIEESKGARSSLEASLKAAEVQCDALRKANMDAQKDSLTMVDSMNEMNNLIDSVNELHVRVQELQVALAASQAKVSRLEEERASLTKEIQVYENHVANSQEKMADMRTSCEEDRARYAQAMRRLDTVTLQLDAVRKELEHKVLENSDKQAQIVELLAMDASNADEIASSKKRVKTLKKALAESSDRIHRLEQEVEEYAHENQSLLEAQANLQTLLEETRASLEATEGKLVVSQTRVKGLEEATRHVDALTKEFESLRSKYKGLLKQQARDGDMYHQLSAKYDEASKEAETRAQMVEERDGEVGRLAAELRASLATIGELKASERSLQDEVARLSVLEPQIALLQSHISDGGAWCETAASALQTRAEELEAALAEVRSSRHEHKCVSEQLATAQERATAAEASVELCNEKLAEAELAKDAALSAKDAMKQEIFVLSLQHKEMMDVTEAMREAEEEAARNYESACEQLGELRSLVDDLREQLRASAVQAVELKSNLHHVTEMRDQAVAENETLRDTVSQMDKSLSAASLKMSDADRELARVTEVCNGLRASLEDTSLSLMESESMVGALELELNDLKTSLAAEEATSRVVKQQCESLERELGFLQDSLLKDSETSDKLGEVIRFIGDERAQLRADISNLNRLVDGLREELNTTRTDARDLHECKLQVDQRLMVAAEENKSLSESVASLQRDVAVLEVVKDQLERDAVAERDEATRSKLFCNEAEREVTKLRNDYQLFNQAMQGRLSAFEPILDRVEASIAESLQRASSANPAIAADEINGGSVGGAQEGGLVDVQSLPEQGKRILASLHRVERRVGELASSIDGFTAAQHEHEEAVNTWRSQRHVLKMVIKLAIAIAVDTMSGTDEATALHDKLCCDDAAMSILGTLGLQDIWDSLAKLVMNKTGLKSAKRLQHLSTELLDTKASLKSIATDLAAERERSGRMLDAMDRACRTMAELRISLDGVGDSRPESLSVDMTAGQGCDLVQEVGLCVDMLKTSVSIVLRRYRSMARSVGSLSISSKTPGMAHVVAKDTSVRRSESTESYKIGAIKL